MLEANSGLQAGLLRVLLEPHKANPKPLLLALGIAMPAAKPKTKRADTFVGIMTRPCKPERKPIRQAGGKMATKALQAEVRDAGYSWDAAKRIKKSLSIEAKKLSMGGTWMWCLPEAIV